MILKIPLSGAPITVEHVYERCENSIRVSNLGSIPSCSLTIEYEWIDSKQASRYLGISERVLFNLTSNGRLPFYKFGRRNRYRLDELKRLLLTERRGPL